MIINVLTLFPEMFDGILNTSILGRAVDKEAVKFNVINIRDYSLNKHGKVDDEPYGGGQGMVMTCQPLMGAVSSLRDKGKVIYMTPKGDVLNQTLCQEFSGEGSITLVCGHYEGIDQRVIDSVVDREVSIGDFVMTGGELAAMVLIDAVVRLLPGVLKNETSYEDESHYNGLLEYPHYTRPADYEGLKVPDVLLSGHHKNIEAWRYEESVRLTQEKRPDMVQKLLKSKGLDQKEKEKIIKIIKSQK